jgi:hypothetical protein
MLSYAKVSLTATMASIVWIVGRLALVADELFSVARACRPSTRCILDPRDTVF